MNTHGKGAMSVARPASSAVAPTVPRRSYICPAKSGNTAANVLRSALLLAIALAAIGRYATTRYVKTEVKMKTMPVPKGTDAMIGTIHGTPRYVVNASQKSPMGASSPPTCPMMSPASGGGCPLCFARMRALYLKNGERGRAVWRGEGAPVPERLAADGYDHTYAYA